jgi:hypothetical protein
VKGKSLHDICDTLCQMTGTLTFVIVPGAAGVAAAGVPVTGAAGAPPPAAKDQDVPETVVNMQ